MQDAGQSHKNECYANRQYISVQAGARLTQVQESEPADQQYDKKCSIPDPKKQQHASKIE